MLNDSEWSQFREPIDNHTAKTILGDQYKDGFDYMMISEPRCTYIVHEENGEEVVVKLEEDPIDNVQPRSLKGDVRYDLIGDNRLKPNWPQVIMAIFGIVCLVVGICLIILLYGA